jgi:hypothetical protein
MHETSHHYLYCPKPCLCSSKGSNKEIYGASQSIWFCLVVSGISYSVHISWEIAMGKVLSLMNWQVSVQCVSCVCWGTLFAPLEESSQFLAHRNCPSWPLRGLHQFLIFSLSQVSACCLHRAPSSEDPPQTPFSPPGKTFSYSYQQRFRGSGRMQATGTVL